jgi:sterol desaturase/sphingolipid hydroxylase (fatty acid hydroxylase superfamily)
MESHHINRSQEPVRLFRSDLLEFFTHIHPLFVLIVWAPVAFYFFIRAIAGSASGSFPTYIPLGFLIGILFWTLVEYLAHRFVFHYRPRSPRQERLIFLFHGIHHYQPHVKTRLVMPPAVSIPLALPFYALFHLVFHTILDVPNWIDATFSGFVTGYLAYDMLHYATHHSRMRFRLLKFLKRYHMIHHFQTPDGYFGVTSPLWDIVFRTR